MPQQHNFKYGRCRIALVTTLWGRPELTNIILRRYHQIRTELQFDMKSGIELVLVAVGSTFESRQIAESCGWGYVHHVNEPLNRKWNAGTRRAMELYDPDAIIIVGSDDMIDTALLYSYRDKIGRGFNWFGLKDLWFFDATKGRLGYWPGYNGKHGASRIGEPIGCARCHSRAVLAATQGILYPEDVELMRALDRASSAFLHSFDMVAHTFTLDEIGGKAVDIKIGHNITDFKSVPYTRIYTGRQVRDYLSPMFDQLDYCLLVSHWNPDVQLVINNS